MDFTKMEEQLTGDYREAFEKVQLYATLKEINENIANEHILDLYDLLFTAQTKQQPVEKLLGGDVETFCENYFQDYTREDRLRGIFEKLYRIAKSILILELIIYLLDRESFSGNIFTMRTDLSAYLIGLLSGLLLNVISDKIILPMGLRKKRPKMICYYFMILIIFAALVVVCAVFVGDGWISVPLFPLLLITVLYIAGYLLVRSVWRMKHYGTVRDVKRKELKKLVKDSYATEPADKDLQTIYYKGWKKRYERLHRKKRMTSVEFYQLLLKEEKKTERVIRFTPVLYVIIVVFLVCVVASENVTASEGGLYDTLIFAVIVSVAEYLIYRLFSKIENSNAKERKRILAECRESGMDFIAFIDSNLSEEEQGSAGKEQGAAEN